MASARLSIRSFEPEVRERVLQRFDETVRGVVKAMDCQVEIDLQRLTPATINEMKTAGTVQAAARRLFPQVEIDPANFVTMGSEDFAFILEKVPGCFFFVGSANPEKGLAASHHHPQFDFDEIVLPSAAALMSEAVVTLLSRE